MHFVPARSCLLLILVMVLGSASAGCRRAGYLDGKERENPMLVKANEMLEQEDYPAAVTLFNRVLETYPGMARPHLDVALVLHDHQKDYVRAIYHYRRYLELRPDTEKRAMVNARITLAERLFVAQRVTAGGVDGRSIQDLLDENQALRSALAAVQMSAAELVAEVTSLRDAERRRMRENVTGALRTGDVEPDRLPETGAAAATRPPVPVAPYPLPPPEQAVEPVAPPRLPPPEQAVEPVAPALMVPAGWQTYTVRSGDSLSKIAYKVYGDATQWRAIQEANKDTLGDSVNVRVGQLLVIP